MLIYLSLNIHNIFSTKFILLNVLSLKHNSAANVAEKTLIREVDLYSVSQRRPALRLDENNHLISTFETEYTINDSLLPKDGLIALCMAVRNGERQLDRNSFVQLIKKGTPKAIANLVGGFFLGEDVESKVRLANGYQDFLTQGNLVV